MKNKLLITLFLLLFFSVTATAQDKFKVVLDAGHGGSDPGNTGIKGSKFFEKDIVLKIALKVGKLLEQDRSIEVIYTRKDDTFIELHERGSIAHKSEADIFVSIHCDAFDKTTVNGAGTFVLGLHENDRNFNIAKKENSVILLEDNYEQQYDGFDPNSPEAVIGITMMQEEYLDQSLTLASMIQTNMVKVAKRKDRLVKQAGFLVLRNTFMPSVLVETGFLTNKQEGAFLSSDEGQQKIAKSIYAAVLKYKKQYDANKVKEEPKPEAPKDASRIFKGVDFKVQIASSSKKVRLVPQNFKGLKGVTRTKIGSHFKYYFGNTSDYTEISKLKKEAKAKYPSAFVVAFKGDKKVSLKSVLDSEKK